MTSMPRNESFESNGPRGGAGASFRSSRARFFTRLFMVGLGMVLLSSGPVAAQRYRVFFGTYTGGESQGIYTCTFDSRTGEAGDVVLAAATDQPSFIALHPSGRYLYAVNETVDDQGQKSGGVSAFAVDAESGELTLLNRQLARGGAPCHLNCSSDGKFVLVANYVGGNCSTLAINDDGTLEPAGCVIQHQGSSVNAARQEGPHAHSINLDSTEHYAVTADLGTDRLYVHGFDAASGELSVRPDAELTCPPGSGPRHFAFHPDGRHAFVIQELDSTLGVLRWSAEKGTFDYLGVHSTLPEDDATPNSTAEVVVHPSGKWIYGSNRGHNSLAIFRWMPEIEDVELIANQSTLGEVPRNFAIEPTGRFLLAANQESGSVVIFAIDPETGKLAERQRLAVPKPVCVRFLPLTNDGK